jgi:hypothetical protein
MRTIIDLPQDQLQRLSAWAATQGISRAEAVRRSVDQLLQRNQVDSAVGFGLWAQGAPASERDGLVLQRELREEWPE